MKLALAFFLAIGASADVCQISYRQHTDTPAGATLEAVCKFPSRTLTDCKAAADYMQKQVGEGALDEQNCESTVYTNSRGHSTFDKRCKDIGGELCLERPEGGFDCQVQRGDGKCFVPVKAVDPKVLRCIREDEGFRAEVNKTFRVIGNEISATTEESTLVIIFNQFVEGWALFNDYLEKNKPACYTL